MEGKVTENIFIAIPLSNCRFHSEFLLQYIHDEGYDSGFRFPVTPVLCKTESDVYCEVIMYPV